MGTVVQLSEAALSETGSASQAVYPVTSTHAVYDADNTRLDYIIDELKLLRLNYGGVLDVTSTNVVTTMRTALTASNTKIFFLCGNAAGEVTGGYAVCDSSLAQLLHGTDSRSVAVNLGDIILAFRNNGVYYTKLIPVNDAKKPADAGGVGTYGIMVPNDKAKLDQAVEDIDKTVFRTYQGEYNMNYCGWYGYYQYCTLGRPAGSVDGEYYVLRVANGGTETDSDGNTWVILEQTAYSCADPKRVFRRIVKTKDRSKMDTEGNVTWGEWSRIGADVDDALSSTSENPVQNKVVNAAIEDVSKKVNDMLDGAPEAYDTLKEIGEYITTHKDEYAALQALVNNKDVKMILASSSSAVSSSVSTSNSTNYLNLIQGTSKKANSVKITGSGYTTVTSSAATSGVQTLTIKTSVPAATTSTAGLISATDKTNLDAMYKSVYKENYSMSLSPTLLEKGVSTAITGTLTGNISTAWNTSTISKKYTASNLVIKAGSTTITPTSTGTNSNGYSYFTYSVADTTTFAVTCTMNSQSKSFSGTVTAVYPKYYGSNSATTMTSATILALTKQSLATSATGSGVKVAVTKGNYLWLCVPSSMKISLVKDANTNIEVSMLSYTPTTVAVTGKGNYNCYRSQHTMNNTETLTLNITA